MNGKGLEKVLENLMTHPLVTMGIACIFFMVIWWIASSDKHSVFKKDIFPKVFGYMVMYGFLAFGAMVAIFLTPILNDNQIYIVYGISFLSIISIFVNIRRKNKNNSNKKKIVAKQVSTHSVTKGFDLDGQRKKYQDKKLVETIKRDFNGIEKLEMAFPLNLKLRSKIVRSRIWTDNEKETNNIVRENRLSANFRLEIKQIAFLSNTTRINSFKKVHIGIINAIYNTFAVKKNNKDKKIFESKLNEVKSKLSTNGMSRYELDKFLFKEYKEASKTKWIIDEYGREKEDLGFIYPLTNLELVAEGKLDEDFVNALKIINMVKAHPFGAAYYVILEKDDYFEEKRKIEEELRILEEKAKQKEDEEKENNEGSSGDNKESHKEETLLELATDVVEKRKTIQLQKDSIDDELEEELRNIDKEEQSINLEKTYQKPSNKQ